jgi:hypothetical protein
MSKGCLVYTGFLYLVLNAITLRKEEDAHLLTVRQLICVSRQARSSGILVNRNRYPPDISRPVVEAH